MNCADVVGGPVNMSVGDALNRCDFGNLINCCDFVGVLMKWCDGVFHPVNLSDGDRVTVVFL